MARGFQQRPGFDYFETFAPVAQLKSVRAILALAASNKLCIQHFDLVTAFLNGKLEGTVYMDPTVGVETDKSNCLMLKKALSKHRELGTTLWTNTAPIQLCTTIE